MPVATKKLRSNRAWIERHINDPFVKRSRAEGYRARSVYKLIELDEKEHLLKPGSTVVDLGSAPGSWTQVADAARSLLLNELALEFCLEHLAPNGVFVTKAFQGSGYSQYVESLKRVFKKVAAKKPEASRDTSAEVYLVSRGLKAPK